MKKMQQLLTSFRIRKFDTKSGAAETTPEFALDFRVFLQGFLWIASCAAVLLIWKFENFQASLPVWGVVGGSLLVLLFGLFFIRSFSEFSNKKNILSYILFILGWIVLAASGLAFSMGQPKFKNDEFPGCIPVCSGLVCRFYCRFSCLGCSGSRRPGACIGCGRAAQTARRFQGRWTFSQSFQRECSTEKNLRTVREQLLNEQWSQAIIALNQIDLTQKRNQPIRVEVLFNLAFANFKVEHLIESKTVLKRIDFP